MVTILTHRHTCIRMYSYVYNMNITWYNTIRSNYVFSFIYTRASRNTAGGPWLCLLIQRWPARNQRVQLLWWRHQKREGCFEGHEILGQIRPNSFPHFQTGFLLEMFEDVWISNYLYDIFQHAQIELGPQAAKLRKHWRFKRGQAPNMALNPPGWTLL